MEWHDSVVDAARATASTGGRVWMAGRAIAIGGLSKIALSEAHGQARRCGRERETHEEQPQLFGRLEHA